MKEQTSVQWLTEQLGKKKGFTMPSELLKVAVEMEKLQIVHAHLTGLIYSLDGSASEQALKYYNDTYKTQEQ
jgi:hypothetical protein